MWYCERDRGLGRFCQFSKIIPSNDCNINLDPGRKKKENTWKYITEVSVIVMLIRKTRSWEKNARRLIVDGEKRENQQQLRRFLRRNSECPVKEARCLTFGMSFSPSVRRYWSSVDRVKVSSDSLVHDSRLLTGISSWQRLGPTKTSLLSDMFSNRCLFN